MILTSLLPKFQIRVEIGSENDEAFEFASQIRAMLNQAHFTTPESDTNQAEGIHQDSTAIVWNDLNHPEWSDIAFYAQSNNWINAIFYQPMGLGTPMTVNSSGGGATNACIGALFYIFNEIGIKAGPGDKPDWAIPNGLVIYVRQKPQ